MLVKTLPIIRVVRSRVSGIGLVVERRADVRGSCPTAAILLHTGQINNYYLNTKHKFNLAR